MPAIAQVHGIPASATSISDGRIMGIPASVTSLGPNGFSDDGGSFSNVRPRFDSRFDSGFRLSGQRNHAGHLVPVAVPYPVYVIPEGYDSQSDLAAGSSAADAARLPQAQPEPQRIILEIRDTREQKSTVSETSIAQKVEQPRPQATREEPTPAATLAATPSATLVFRDGHQQQITDYAIMGSSLFDLSKGGTRKIPLDTLDIPATQKINEERGIIFNLP